MRIGNIIAANKAFCTLVGRTLFEVNHTSLSEVFDRDVPVGTSKYDEFVNLIPSLGDAKPVHIKLIPVVSNDRAILGVGVIKERI